MEYIQRLPFILGAVVAIVVGMLSYSSTADMKQVYVKMALGMIVFYILGVFIKNTVLKINSDIEEKKRKIELERLEKEKQEEEAREEQAREEAAAHKQGNKSSKIDIKVEDDDEFIPLNLEMLSDKLKDGNVK